MSATSSIGGDMNTAPAGDMNAPAPASAPAGASINTENLEEKMVKIFGKDILIENKEDFAKLIQAANKYNESLKNPIIEDEEIEESLILKQISESVSGIKKASKTNDSSINLIYENELGGLNYEKEELLIFEAPKKRTGPKSGGNPYIYEEIKNTLK